jgi:alpha-L-rhamnosidase
MQSKAAWAAVLLIGAAWPCWAGVTIDKPRCEYQVDPLGLDVAQPRLSWVLRSDERGEKQTAYQVLVASAPDVLAKDRGDRWDSGRVASDQTIHVAYAGKPLGSRMQCFWKVRAWDKSGQASAWSKPAQWTMGLLDRSDWGAKWIAYHDPAERPIVTPHNGYHSALAATADMAKWVAIDLGGERTIDAVRLYPARPFDFVDTPGFLFPVRFQVEVAAKVDFSDAKVVVDRTAADVANPRLDAPIYRFPPVAARCVRLTVTRLAHYPGGDKFGFALAELQVLAGGKNVAERSAVTATDSIEAGGWSKAKLVDGRLLPERGSEIGQQPASMVRKEFDLHGSVRRAVVSVTGLGLYELSINGRRVGDHLLAPEYTRYAKRIQYQTYDVTALVRQGRNAVGAQLGGGWWTGPLMCMPPLENARYCLLMRLDVELADGTTQTVVTDPSWQATTDGPIRKAGIYFGETYDATKEKPGWDEPGFAAAGWRPVQVLPHPAESEHAVLVAQSNESIRVLEERRPVKMTEPKPGVYVFDLGQNMVGWCRLTAAAAAGTKINVRYAEVLNDDGTIYTANLRGAAQINEYTWRGGRATLEPHFTYHGFRYVEVTGLPSRPAADAVVGRVFHSAAPETGSFACSNDLLNKIMHCVRWVQRANMMSVPTDCPQRTERLGWMGDIQAFSQTAIFQRDMAGFFTKWAADIRESQADDGRYPDVAPHISDPNHEFSGVPAWGDAGTVIPWRTYQNYADVRLLAQHFNSARRWVDFIAWHNPNLLWLKSRGNDYNDWLNGDVTILKDYPRGISAIPNEVFATAFFAHSTDLVARMARVLGRSDDAAKYGRLFDGIKAAFGKAYVAADGHIKGDTQSGYALALHFNLLDESLRPKATEHMLAAIRKYKDHPSTGIQSTHRMLLELTRNGQHAEAYRLMTLRTVPSWGYMVEEGATTIWERWDGYVKGRGFQDPGMNSFNHWAFGAVGEWVWRELAGLNLDEDQPGYKHFLIRPRPCGDLGWVKWRYDSIHGPIASDWKIADGRFQLRVEIPANTTATVHVPARDAAAVTESGKPAAEAAGVKFVKMEGGAAVFFVEAGRYAFAASR